MKVIGSRNKNVIGYKIKGPSKWSRAKARNVCMGIVVDREEENYEVSSLILEHNHSLHLPQNIAFDVVKEKFQSYKLLKSKQLMMQELVLKLTRVG